MVDSESPSIAVSSPQASFLDRPVCHLASSALLQQSNALSDDGSIRDEAGLVADSLTPTLSSARLGLSRDIGGRASDDDEASIFSVQTPLGRRLTVAAVLDGHHGAAVSRLASEALPRLFAETARKLPAPRLSASAGDAEDVAGALPALVAALEEELYRAFQAGIFATGGSTLLLAVLEEGRLTLANVGDCRAVLSSRGAPLLLNEAHSPGAPGERARFLAAGVVAAADHIQASDINVTRSLGDFDLGPPIKWRDERGAARGPLLSAPVVRVHEIEPADEFVVLASDGLWDYLSPESTVITDARRALRAAENDPQPAAESLVRAALERQRAQLHEGTPGDNVTVVVLSLRRLPTLPRHSASRLNLLRQA